MKWKDPEFMNLFLASLAVDYLGLVEFLFDADLITKKDYKKLKKRYTNLLHQAKEGKL